LAGKPSDDAIDGNSIGSELCPAELSHISIDRYFRPIFVEDTNGKRLNLAERDSLEPASALQAKVEAANAGEQ
jgi:hypothetical protein